MARNHRAVPYSYAVRWAPFHLYTLEGIAEALRLEGTAPYAY